MSRAAPSVVLASLLSIACGSEPAPEAGDPPGPAWQPGMVFRSPEAPKGRGLRDVRGLIHAHTVYSHDACDDSPRDQNDLIREDCLADFRRGLCQTAHDFVFLSDHTESFARSEYPDVLLHRPEQGDTLIERGGAAVANWLACADAPPALVLAGNEGAMMPVGLDRHVAATRTEREAIYGGQSTQEIDALSASGAVVLAQHTEDWTPEQLGSLPFDGFEMFNLHANVITGAGGVFRLLSKINFPEELPHSDLTLLPILNEDVRYIERWGTVLARGARRVTTIGTDCHQNTMQQLLPDGERIDSYRRMMLWMSNHLLIRPAAEGTWSDVELDEALGSGRLYGAFEVMGYPVGFDFRAQGADGVVVEMGGSATLAGGVELFVSMPEVQALDREREAPLLNARLLRAREQGWDLVAESDSDLVFAPTEPGAYRAEIRMKPRHLLGWLSSFADIAEQDLVWIYSNAIYVE